MVAWRTDRTDEAEAGAGESDESGENSSRLVLSGGEADLCTVAGRLGCVAGCGGGVSFI